MMDNSKLNEEFNNFMHKVTEVESIIQKLASQDKNLQAIGHKEADKYLGENSENVLENINEENVVLKMTSSRTVINKKALEKDNKNRETMSQEAFMEEVARDADRRYQDRLRRKERMETFKKQATLAFRRGEYERALILYDKAIEQIKDSCLLYNNRALTNINLKLFDKAKEDLKQALRLNEDCLKSWLLLAKVYFIENNDIEFEKSIEEAVNRHPKDKEFIEGYVQNLKEAGS